MHPSLAPPPLDTRDHRRVRIVAGAAALAGAVLVLSATWRSARVLRAISSGLSPVDPVLIRPGIALLVGSSLVYLATHLARGKRAAWRLAVLVATTSATIQVIRLLTGGGRPVALAVDAIVLLLLIGWNRSFTVETGDVRLGRVLGLAVAYVGVVAAVGSGVLFIANRGAEPSLSFRQDVVDAFTELLGLGPTTSPTGEAHPALVGVAFLGAGLAGIGLLVAALNRPPEPAAMPTEAERALARRLVESHGTDTLAYFALHPDKRYFFSRDGHAMVAYAYLGRCALVSGDPIGREGSIDPVIDEFRHHCHQHGWSLAFLAVRQDEVGRYRRHGLRSTYLGDEAVIDCTRFTLSGRRNKSMRQSVHRVARTHRFALIPETSADAELIEALNALSARWRGGRRERGFTMTLNTEVTGQDPDHVLCVALDDAGRPGGFLRILPVAGRGAGYTLDLMRHDPAAPNGMTEFLVASTVGALAAEGHRQLSVNFAFMGRLYEPGATLSWRDRALRAVVTPGDRVFQIRSLRDFNRRFRPRWQPRVVAYEHRRSLPLVLALLCAAEGFLPHRRLAPPRAPEPA